MDSDIEELLRAIDPNQLLPQAQTKSLAHRILTSSIGATTNAPSSKNSTIMQDKASTLKKLTRALKKCTSEQDPSSVRQSIENAYDNIYKKEGDAIADSALLLCTRLAASSSLDPSSSNANTRRNMPFTSTSTDASHYEVPSNQLSSDHPAASATRTKSHIKQAVIDEEFAILRECIHAMNYTNSGDLIRFHPTTQEEGGASVLTMKIRPGLLPFHLPPDIRSQIRNRNTSLGGGLSGMDAIGICTEAGYVYHVLVEFIRFVSENKDSGIIPRALASCLDVELEKYRQLLIELEQQVIHGNLSLRRLLTVVYGFVPTLQTMMYCVNGVLSHTKDETGNHVHSVVMNGGQLLTALYLHSLHGEETHKSIAARLLKDSSRPWYDLLFDWLMKGNLISSAREEFFITEDVHIPDEDMWRSSYHLVHAQIPFVSDIGRKGGLISHELAEGILVLGKSINFIRRCLMDTSWELDVRDLVRRDLWDEMLDKKGHLIRGLDDDSINRLKEELGLLYTCDDPPMDISGRSGNITIETPLEKSVRLASSQVHKYLLASLFNDHHLLAHLQGMKEILFLGQGDFICTLMDGLHAEFASRLNINEIYSLQLMNIVHDALRTTNAKFLPPYVIDRVLVKLLPIDSQDSFWVGSSDDSQMEGWDIFSLSYAINAPLTAVVHPEAMNKYHLVFNLLFRLKRIEWMMNNTWRQSTVLNHALQVMMSKYGEVSLGPASSVKRNNDFARMKRLLRKFSATRQCILHFLTNIQSYLMFEVLESGWKKLRSRLQSSRSLDEVIIAHNDYLDEIVAKSLLSLDPEKAINSDSQNISLQLRMVLTSAFAFCKSHEKIFGEALIAIEKADMKQNSASRRTKAGKWGFDHFDKDVEGNNIYRLAEEGRLEEIELIAEEFDISLRNLLSMINDRVNGGDFVQTITSPTQTPVPIEANRTLASYNDSLRFLTFRLDFSAFYGL